MKNIKLIVLTFIIGFFSLSLTAQTVDELQSGYLKALGGKEKLSSLKDVFIESSVELMGMQMQTRQWVVYGKAARQEVDVQGQKIITFLSADKGWMINPLMGSTQAQPIPDQALKAAEGSLVAGSELTDYQSRGMKASFEGKDSVNSLAVYKIRLSKDDYESTYYLDPGTYYLLRQVVTTKVGDQPITQTTDFSDYRKTPEGYVFPYSTVVSNAMTGEIKSTVSNISANTSPDLKALENPN